MGTITLRIDEEIEKQIDERRGDKPKSDFYREIILGFLNTPEKNLNTNVFNENTHHIQALEQQISDLRDVLADLRADKGKLMALLNQEQALHLKTLALLPAPAGHWWQFWRKQE